MLPPDPPQQIEQYHDDGDVHYRLLPTPCWEYAGAVGVPTTTGCRAHAGRCMRRQGGLWLMVKVL